MTELPLSNPTEGLASIQRLDTGRVVMPARSEAQVVGSPVERQVQAIYGGASVEDAARSLTFPHLEDPSLLLPTSFATRIRDLSEALERMTQAAGDQASDELRRAEAALKRIAVTSQAFDEAARRLVAP